MRWLRALGLVVLLFGAGAVRGQELVPLVLPWDDTGPAPFAASDMPLGPLDEASRLAVGADGHLVAAGRRQRLLGVNLCFGGNFPSSADAPRIAGRLAKFRVNAVRFHHMDSARYPRGILAARARDSRQLEPEALDRLHGLVHELGKRQIYSDLNLLVGRRFVAADGLPAEIETLDPKQQHLVGFFFEPLIALQKEYARQLLTAPNRHSGCTLADDPAVAIVEINNENGLVHGWLAGDLDALPEPFAVELRRRWNAWLARRYASDEALRRAWGSRDEPLGDQQLVNGDFQRGTDAWVLEQHGEAQATVRAEVAAPAAVRTPSTAARIQVERPGAENWHVQFHQPRLKVRAGQVYSVRLRARADRDTSVTLRLGQAHAPWQGLGFDRRLRLSIDWRDFQFTVVPTADDDNARLGWSDLGQHVGTYWFAPVFFQPGGRLGLAADQTLAHATIPLIAQAAEPPTTRACRRDWVDFLREVERDYWRTMARYLRGDLHVKALLLGTISGTSPASVQAEFDVIDSHAYWQHPRFPGRSWDPENWLVANESMVNAPPGVLGRIAAEQIVGKPHLVTEYNHPAPNTYSSEAPLLLGAYAALQDWDGVFLFAYSHRTNDWNARAFTSFFDIDQHPLKMANLAVAAQLFRRVDVEPARDRIVVHRSPRDELEALVDSGHAWHLADAETFGVDSHQMLVHRVGWQLATDDGPNHKRSLPPAAGPRTSPSSAPVRRWTSDTGQLIWDATRPGRGMVVINTPRSKGMVGFVDGRTVELSDIRMAPATTRQDWCTIMLSRLDEGTLQQPGRAVLVATGWAENTGLRWRSAARDSVGRDWGGPPSLVEAVAATIELPWARERVSAWALDELGRRAAPLAVDSLAPTRCQVRIGHPVRTIWYEIEVR